MASQDSDQIATKPYIFINQPRWNETLNFKEIEEHLAHDSIIVSVNIANYLSKSGHNHDFDNNVRLITLNSGLKAVFKPGQDCYAEVAAYRAALFLGLRLVPPTVLRTIDTIQGSLQFFVEPSSDPLSLKNKEEYYKDIDEKTFSEMKLFYFVFGQWDINSTNQVIQINNGKKYIALIDNAGLTNQSQIQYGDFAFVRRGYSDKRNDSFDTSFPFNHTLQLNNPSKAEIEHAFGEFMSYDACLNLWSRYPSITYVLWRNSLWIQYYKNNHTVKPNVTHVYYQSTLDAYTRLTQDALELIWSEGLTSNKQHYQALINLTLQRKQVMLDAAHKSPIRKT